VTPARRLRIAYVSACDARSRRAWSGIHYFLARALERHCGEVIHIGPVAPRIAGPLHRLAERWNALMPRRYSPFHSILMSRGYARLIGRRLRQAECDVIFAPVASTEIACLRTVIPIVYMSDATFALLNGYYPWLDRLMAVSVREGHWVERSAIARAAALVYSSPWAAHSAVADYGAPAEKVHVVPFGANVEALPPVHAVVSRIPSSPLRLLFLGTDWDRKGGEIAVEALSALRERNVKAELIVCGCTPPPTVATEHVTVIPFLDKDDPGDRARFEQLLLTSDLMLVPTRADCSPIAFAEANAFGLPVVTTDTGGVAGVIQDGRNGLLLPFAARGQEYAERIASLFLTEGRYERMAAASRRAFDERLNWDAWGREVGNIMARVASVRVA